MGFRFGCKSSRATDIITRMSISRRSHRRVTRIDELGEARRQILMMPLASRRLERGNGRHHH
jgi:hypothetical protein